MITLILFITAICFLYYYEKKKINYWKLKGVKHDSPMPYFGNNIRNFFMIKSISEISEELYWKYPAEKVVGFYRATRPELIIRDPKLIKKILITDFAHFYARGLNPDKDKIEPLLRNLFFADGDLWRLLRQPLTPAFTSSKIKAMFPIIVEQAERLQARALTTSRAGREVDAHDLLKRYTTDFIGACGFGLESDALHNKNSEFRKLGTYFSDIRYKEYFMLIIKQVFPNVFKNLKTMTRVEKHVMQLVTEVLRKRNYLPSGRNDFIDILLECKKKGTVVGELIEQRQNDGITAEIATLEMDDELIAAQVYLFYIAGFETTSSAASYTLHELAYNPAVQVKVQQDIDTVLEKYENKLSYDAIKEMKYLEWTFKEGLRVFPSLGFLTRECVRKYTFEDLNLTIDEGVRIVIPVQALHKDPKYFDNAEEFRPERFDPANLDENNKYVYLPFGEGPRACMGERLGMMQSIAGLAAVLAKFTVLPSPSSQRHPPLNPAGIVQNVKGGLPLLFIKRNTTMTLQDISSLLMIVGPIFYL